MELLIIFLLTLTNGVLAMSEAAVIASREPRLQGRVEEGSRGAEVAIGLVKEPNRFLSTVQIGITLVGVTSGAFGGAALADDVARPLAQIDFLAPYADALAFTLVVLFTTYLSLIIGELVPKRLAIQNPEGISSLISRPMSFLSRLAFPLVWFLGKSTDTVLWLLRVRQTEEQPVTEDEIQMMLAQGLQAGVFNTQEQAFISGVFRLDDLRADAIMTPRVETTWLDVNDDPDTLYDKVINADHSRYPVCDGSPDNVIGVVRVRDLLRHVLQGKTLQDLRQMAQPPLFIPESATADHLLERFRGRSTKIGIVVGEHGGVDGIVTINDILSAVVGDIDHIEAKLQDDGSWLIDGLMPYPEFLALLNLKDPPEFEGVRFSTVAGFVVKHLGRIPQVDDHFTWDGFDVQVVSMDERRVEKVRVKQVEDEAEGDEDAETGEPDG